MPQTLLSANNTCPVDTFSNKLSWGWRVTLSGFTPTNPQSQVAIPTPHVRPAMMPVRDTLPRRKT